MGRQFLGQAADRGREVRATNGLQLTQGESNRAMGAAPEGSARLSAHLLARQLERRPQH
jgi:hypothetical protein